MELYLNKLQACNWEWDDSDQLLRDMPDLDDLDFEYEDMVVEVRDADRGDGHSAFALVYNIDTEAAYILIESRDFVDGAPVWENARIVPTNEPLCQPVWAILTYLHAQ